MGTLRQFLERATAGDEFRDLSEEQVEGVVLALMLALCTETTLTEDEIHVASVALLDLPWGIDGEVRRERVMQRCRQRLETASGDDGFSRLLHEIADRMPGRALRERVLRLAVGVHVMDSDLHASEREMLTGLAQAFGFGPERLEQLLAEVRDEVRV